MSTFKFPREFLNSLVQLRSRSGGRVLISPFGAHVLSWQSVGGVERLFLSPKSDFSGISAIRGGVPLIFPQFSVRGSLPRHGFARTQVWSVESVEADKAVFQLSDNEYTQKIWPFSFSAKFVVFVEDFQLNMKLKITNTGDVPFEFTSALHTYLSVQEVGSAVVQGLAGVEYLDQVNNGLSLRDAQSAVLFAGEVDRIYRNAPDELLLFDYSGKMSIKKHGFCDVVVWNPGAVNCAQTKDLVVDAYKKFVCVEAAVAAAPVGLDRGASWQGEQILTVY